MRQYRNYQMPKYELVCKDTGFCRVVWRIKLKDLHNRNHWCYFCDQWDNGLDKEPTFYACSKDHEPEFKTKRPAYLPKETLE